MGIWSIATLVRKRWASPKRPAGFQLGQDFELEQRWVPDTYRWNPSPDLTPNWSSAALTLPPHSNWEVNLRGVWLDTLGYPGDGKDGDNDVAVFDGTVSNKACTVDKPVTLYKMELTKSYTSKVNLDKTITISGVPTDAGGATVFS